MESPHLSRSSRRCGVAMAVVLGGYLSFPVAGLAQTGECDILVQQFTSLEGQLAEATRQTSLENLSAAQAIATRQAMVVQLALGQGCSSTSFSRVLTQGGRAEPAAARRQSTSEPRTNTSSPPPPVQVSRRPEPSARKLSRPVKRTFQLEPIEGRARTEANSNIREYPTTQSDKVGFVRAGESVVLLDRVIGEPWLRVSTDTVEGFIHASLLRASKDVRQVAVSPALAASPKSAQRSNRPAPSQPPSSPQGGVATTVSAETRAKAESGDSVAQYVLANYYAGKSQLFEAMGWWQRAAEQGHAPSQYNLGIAYFRGQDAPKDVDKAMSWWRRAADQGYGPAKNTLQQLREGAR